MKILKISIFTLFVSVAIASCTNQPESQLPDVASPAPDPAPSPAPPISENAGDDEIEVTKCVNVYYDKSKSANFRLGKTHALLLANLLGHFPTYQQTLSPVESYKKGDLDKCEANFYLGSYFDNPLPSDFLADYKSTSRLVTWIGYNFWQLGADFEKAFGYSTYTFTLLDTANTTPDKKPGFFRDITYKGEIFAKYNEWDPLDATKLVAAFEQVKFTSQTGAVSTVLAEARHSVTAEVIPWALQNKNKFYVTEIPFSYTHEGDRYLVFADLLFDFLGTTPADSIKKAVIRLTDVNPMSRPETIQEAVAILKNAGATPHISLQPLFNDPTYQIPGHPGVPQIRLEAQPPLVTVLKQLETEGGVLIWNGSAFEYNNTASGDNEFWNSVTNSPVTGDSADYVLDRLDNAFKSLEATKLSPKIWETPRGAASVLDSLVFAGIFNWSIGRGYYTDYTASALAPIAVSSLEYRSAHSNAASRRSHFDAFTATPTASATYVPQFYPYEIYGDIHRQQILPENLGRVLVGIRNADKILADAKRNLVLRDTWASVYYQPYLLDPAVNPDNAGSGPKDLERIATGLKALGYTFVDLNIFVSTAKNKKGKARIEIQ